MWRFFFFVRNGAEDAIQRNAATMLQLSSHAEGELFRRWPKTFSNRYEINLKKAVLKAQQKCQTLM